MGTPYPRTVREDSERFARICSHGQLTQQCIRVFRTIIYDHYHNFGRKDLPWRTTSDPYAIFVSEIMLQQTRVDRVITKYPEFIAAFPDFTTLAQAPLREVLQVWQGMGYNRRAIALREGAIRVMREFDGVLPRDEPVLATFPGIGRATAASITAFAFNTPTVFIETNVRRVFIHFFFSDREGIHDREILPLVSQTLDQPEPRLWYSALMDYGAMLKKNIPNPNRKSAGYSRQPKFAGSNRQIRGNILRFLLESGEAGEEQLIMYLGLPAARVQPLIRQMIREGFVHEMNGRLTIV
jgi:A/G-specific adenine glycosylase